MTEQKDTLSDREIEILRLVATGAANKEIARQLVISPNTVKVHLRNIFAKIGVTSRTEATLFAVQTGLVKPGADTVVVLPETELDESQAGELPGIVVEDGSNGTPAAVPQPRRQIWRAGIVALIAVILIGAGAAFGARLLAAPAPAPTVAPFATNNPQAVINRWTNSAALPGERMGMGIVEYENAIYIFGGENSSGLDASTLRFNPLEKRWEVLASKPTPVTEVNAALLGEKIYIPGGKLDDGSPTDRLEVYNPREDSWERMADLPVAVSGYALAALEGRLYLFGGRDKTGYRSEVFIYDPQQDQWSEGTGMDKARAFAAAVAVGGKIYVIGGYDGRQALKLNQAYMPSRDGSGENPWETYAPLESGRYGMGATLLASVVYLAGGWGEDGQPDTTGTLQYSAQSDEWSAYDEPPEATGALPGLVASGNFLYIIGGDTGNGPSETMQRYQAIYTISVPLVGSDGEPEQ